MSNIYFRLLDSIQFGKHLPDSIYTHIDTVRLLSQNLQELIKSALVEADQEQLLYNIVKWNKTRPKISLLYYPDFFEESYPSLSQSCVVDLRTGECRVKVYDRLNNPPILHRKEDMLPPSHPQVPYFQQLTLEGERIGLYDDVSIIGFKKTWERLIEERGFMLVDGHIVPNPECLPDAFEQRPAQSELDVARHRTAIRRYNLSTPLQALEKYGYLEQGSSFFDYGCGQGDDLRELSERGIDASGWDPHFRSNAAKISANVVNLGFVLNVIEDPQERAETLRQAFSLCNNVMSVSVMLDRGRTLQHELCSDGVLTSRGTFQKYFGQREFKDYLEEVLESNAVAVGPGVCFVFRDALEEQVFLSERLSYRSKPSKLRRKKKPPPKTTPKKRPQKRESKPAKLSPFERNPELCESFWEYCHKRGRQPVSGEFADEKELLELFGSLRKAFGKCSAHYGEDSFLEAQMQKREDLLTYFALSLFNKKVPYRKIAPSLQKDVLVFFGSYKKAKELATELLYQAGEPDSLEIACQEAVLERGVGYLTPDQYYFHSSLLGQLPPILRTYVGCAGHLHGDVESADVIKIHIHSGKLTLLIYDDFQNKAVPELIERVKIKLREQYVDYFRYGGEFPPQPLYLKSLWLSSSFSHYEEQASFDKALRALKVFDFSRHGPSKDRFYETLEHLGYKIDGFKLVAL